VTVAELMEVLASAPGDTPVGRQGYFGELVPLYGARVSTRVSEEHGPKNNWGRSERVMLPVVVVLDIGDLGEGPD